jgi:hypothetical protein
MTKAPNSDKKNRKQNFKIIELCQIPNADIRSKEAPSVEHTIKQ